MGFDISGTGVDLLQTIINSLFRSNKAFGVAVMFEKALEGCEANSSTTATG
jgi:hypothetical protein